MLEFSIGYQKAVETITSNHKNDLKLYELTEEEWDITLEL